MTVTTAKQRLNADDRRASILQAALPMFAERGMSSVTTKELAAAAGISEALLFRHFPTKESLFEAVEAQCFQAPLTIGRQLDQLVPSTRSLCVFVHILFSACRRVPEDHHMRLTQIMLRSLLSDGEFARSFLSRHLASRAKLFEECVKSAEASGDLKNPMPGPINLWFPHHVSVMLKLLSFPARAVVDYDLDDDELIKQGVIFSLRGLGLSQAAIDQHYNSDLIAQLKTYWELNHAI